MKIKGFTLIELLIALTILAILAVIGLVTFTNVGKRTRDSKRLGDIESIQKALEVYMQEINKYPPTGTCVEISSYMQGSVPRKDSQNNPYNIVCTDTTSYCACSSSLEVITGNSSNQNCTWSSAGAYYCLKQMQ